MGYVICLNVLHMLCELKLYAQASKVYRAADYKISVIVFLLYQTTMNVISIRTPIFIHFFNSSKGI